MGFWEDATPATKGTIVVGGLLIVYFGIAFMAGLWPYNAQITDVQQTRGLTPATAAP